MRETKTQYSMRAIQKLSRKLFVSEEEVYELKKELAELKANIPQIQHDAIVKMQRASNAVVPTNCLCNSLNDHDKFAYKYAKNILTQAKEQ